jgi:CheY-like chemotaxis protein
VIEARLTRHIASDAPRVLVVDGSRVARLLISQVLHQTLPNAVVIACASGAEARTQLESGVVDLVTTALMLPDMDGTELAQYVREHAPQAYIPIIVVSGNVDERLAQRALGDAVTDYFDKSRGYAALAEFIRGYVAPPTQAEGHVLYVEDSKVVALATRRMLEKYGLTVTHVASVEEALAAVREAREAGRNPADIVLTDVYLKGGATGKTLLEHLRGEFGYTRETLPALVMTADDNPANQAALLRAGANDLVHKPVEERLLVTKLLFQLRVAQRLREQAARQPADA